MDTAPLSGDSARFESAVDKQRRLDREAKLLAAARAKIAGGLAVDAADVDAWIDSIGTDDELPPPYPNR
jgi:predicted transcriptional regulator